MNRTLILPALLAATIAGAAQVSLPFTVKAPDWKGIVTVADENNPPMIFRTPNASADIIVAEEGPEYDTYRWESQSVFLGEGESRLTVGPNSYLPLLGTQGAWAHVLIESDMSGWVPCPGNDGLKRADTYPLTHADLVESSSVIAWQTPDKETYAICADAENGYGWSVDFYVGKLAGGYLVMPYVCTVETSPELKHPGILNGKLGQYDLEKFTWHEVEYILSHSKPIGDGQTLIQYGVRHEGAPIILEFMTR